MNKNNSNRRQFVKTIVAAAAATAVSPIIVYGKESTFNMGIQTKHTGFNNLGMYQMNLPAVGSIDMVTHIDLKESLKLAGDNLIANLDPKRHYLPNWNAIPDKDGTVEVELWWEGHNLGRWWDAMLQLKDVISYDIPVEVTKAMEENMFSFFNNPDHLCLAPFDMKGVEIKFDMHSLREGLLGLNALIKYNHSGKASQQGHSMIESLLQLIDDNGSWNLEKCNYARRVGLETARNDWGLVVGYPGNHGRLIEALIWFYEVTGDPLALHLAEQLARFHFANTTQPDGLLGKQPGNHTHSYLGTLKGLLLYGELTDQREYIDTISATYLKTVRTRLKKSGFISHDMDKDRIGEPTSPGDAAQLALWLATRHNFTELFDDVERIIRARLIPCQIMETQSLKQIELAPLLVGAYGGMYLESHAGKIATTDITAAVSHTLIDIYRHIAIHKDNTLKINFHFDYEDQHVRIVSERARYASVSIVPKQSVNVLVRIPRWTSQQSVVLKIAGKQIDFLMLGDYALVPKDLLPGTIELTYALPVSTEIERTNNIDFSITWRGDEVIGISPNSDFYPFYPDSFV